MPAFHCDLGSPVCSGGVFSAFFRTALSGRVSGSSFSTQYFAKVPFFKKKIVHSFAYFWLCWVVADVCGLSSGPVSRGSSPVVMHGLLIVGACWGAQALQ